MAHNASAETQNRMTDQVIASDLLVYAKAAVTAYASAASASSTPTVRSLLRKQLDQAFSFREQVDAYMTERGWRDASDLREQLKSDDELTQNTLNLLK
jgi:similar to spore coat protein